MERWQYRVLDVFTDRPLAGNQLAVFEDAVGIPESLLQPLAFEIGFSETVFLYPAEQGGDARMRIFTPGNEVPFAGHPTLGTAVVLADLRQQSELVLETGRGPIPVSVSFQQAGTARGAMQQPVPSITAFPEQDALFQALGVERSVLPVILYDNGIPHVYVTLQAPADVAAVRPNPEALAALMDQLELAVLGFNVFAGAGTTWKTRMFAPVNGILEDAATGSAAGPLALHLARHGLIPWGEEITISQGAEIGRPSELFACASLVDNQVGLIEVGGNAVQIGGGWFDADLLRASLPT